MKCPSISSITAFPLSLILLLVLILFATSSCIRRGRSNPPQSSAPVITSTATDQQIVPININLASGDELAGLPGIGPTLAERIVAHREKYGPFKRTEHLLMVRGVSDKLFREIRSLITVG